MVTVIHEKKEPKLLDIEFVKQGEFFLSENHLFVYLGNYMACDLDSINNPVIGFEVCDVVEIPNLEIKVLKD